MHKQRMFSAMRKGLHGRSLQVILNTILRGEMQGLSQVVNAGDRVLHGFMRMAGVPGRPLAARCCNLGAAGRDGVDAPPGTEKSPALPFPHQYEAVEVCICIWTKDQKSREGGMHKYPV